MVQVKWIRLTQSPHWVLTSIRKLDKNISLPIFYHLLLKNYSLLDARVWGSEKTSRFLLDVRKFFWLNLAILSKVYRFFPPNRLPCRSIKVITTQTLNEVSLSQHTSLTSGVILCVWRVLILSTNLVFYLIVFTCSNPYHGFQSFCSY